MERKRRFSPTRRNGQAVLEFALILPIFISLVAISADLARGYGVTMAVHGAARAGAMWAAAETVYDDTCPPGPDDVTLGNVIRNASSDYPNGDWGSTNQCAANGCDVAPFAEPYPCGDPGGCGSGFFAANPGATACFSTGWCETPTADPASCTNEIGANGRWGQLPDCTPPPPTDDGDFDCTQATIVVRVAARLTSFMSAGNLATISYDAFVLPQSIGPPS